MSAAAESDNCPRGIANVTLYSEERTQARPYETALRRSRPHWRYTVLFSWVGFCFATLQARKRFIQSRIWWNAPTESQSKRGYFVWKKNFQFWAISLVVRNLKKNYTDIINYISPHKTIIIVHHLSKSQNFQVKKVMKTFKNNSYLRKTRKLAKTYLYTKEFIQITELSR